MALGGQHLVQSTWVFPPYNALTAELNFCNEGARRMRRIIAGEMGLSQGEIGLSQDEIGLSKGEIGYRSAETV